MATNTIGLNRTFSIYNADGTSFQNLVLHKATYDSVVMSLGDKITGDVYYEDNNLAVTMQEYIEYKRNPDDENELPVRFVLVNPPTIVREGMASDNNELKGMTKYSFEFYHPMCMLANFPFTDVAVESGQGRYLSESKTFSWTGTGYDFIAKINKNLQGTEWVVVPSKDAQSRANLSLLPDKVIHVKSEEKESNMVLSFDKNFVSDALKTAYDTWEVPFVVDALKQGEYTYTDPNNNVIDYYDEGKRFVVVFGLPNDEILDSNDTPYVFRYGQGVGLKNNSRTPKNNKIVTRIVGYGSEDNIPYGYPQIVWNGEDDDPRLQYPIYKGIVGGQYVKLIKHPFTRKTLMPSIYAETVNKKVNPLATGYDPDIEIKDYYDADNTYDNPINVNSPSVAIHQFEDIKPQLGQKAIAGVSAYDEDKADYITEADFRAFINTTVPTRSALTQLHVGEMMDAYDLGESDKRGFVGGSQTYEWELTFDGDFCSVFYNSPDFYYKALVLVQGGSPAIEWDDTMNDDGEYVQSYFRLTLPNTLDFDLYACAAITQEMKINMRSGDCIGCTFNVQVDWDDYKKNFYDTDGNFDPVIGEGHPRNAEKYPNSYHNSITLVVQKDIDTFGRIMPNVYQQPNVGDEFVILGISLPQSYITNAQVELDNAMKDYMRGNNVYYYEYPLKFDEHFLATYTDILAQIRNNVKLRFGYGNDVLTLYVKQMSVKYGNAPLPQYDITLTDDVEVVMNAIGQMAEYAGRTRTQLDELQRTYGDDIVQRINEKLSRVADDIAEGRITFQQGLVAIGNVIFNDELRSPDFESGLYSGKGWRIDKLGNAEMESLRVRSYLEVVELLINRLQAQEGDTVFTDNDQIERVEEKEYNNTTYYVLSLKEKWQGYFTSQQKDNILKGIINTLAANYGNVSDITEEQCVETDGINKYYTSWMKVIDPSDVGETLGRNQIAVILYADANTPANKNFPPCELMTIARWGCDAELDDETLTDAERKSIIRRQSVFSISTSDGRIAKLRGVRSPILQNVNYGTTLGTIPDFIKQWSIYSRLSKNRDYLYAQGVIVSDFIKVDSVGDPITNYVDAGQWQNNTPYLHNAYNEQNAQWETNDVWHNGAYWRCLVTQPYNGVYYEPTDANHLYWRKLLTSGANGQDGTPAPFYTQEWYAWSNDASTASASDEPTISGNWLSYIPAQGTYSYLWKKIIRWDWNNAIGAYEAGIRQYYRMSGTNGTSITVKGHVATTSNLPTTHNDGDAYVVDADGHLYMWSDEANQWLDIGQFQGENGKTYYTHIAWAQEVTYSPQTGEVISVTGFVTVKSPDDNTRNWMGVLVNEDSGTDPSEAADYTWSYTKGVAVVASIDNEMDGVQTDANGKVVSATTVSTSIRIYSNGQLVTTGITAASATLCGIMATPVISGGVVTYQWTIPTTYTFTNGKAAVTLQVTYNNATYSNTFTLMASMGSAAYKLVPSVNEIIKKKSGSFSPATFTCYCTSLSNGVTTDNPTEAIMQYSYNGVDWSRFYSNTQFQSSTVFANSRDKLYLRLRVGSTDMDKQTLSLIEDGTDGIDGIDGVDGEDALTLALDTYAIAFPTDSDYNVGSTLTYTVGVKMFLGNNAQQTITSISPTSSDSGVIVSSISNGVRIVVGEERFVNSVTVTVTAVCAVGSRTAKIILTPAPKGAKGDRGDDGQDGARGKIGRFFYFAGTFNSSNTSDRFLVNDAQAPYFEHMVDGQKRYHVFNYETNGSYTMAQMWSISSGSWNNSPWEAMTNDFKYLITEAMFAEYAKLGSAIFSGDWMISQQGKIDGRALSSITAYMVGSTAYPYTVTIKPYTLFDANHPLGGVASKNTYPTTISSSETSHNVIGTSGRKAGVLYKVTSRVDGTFSGTPLRFQIDKNGVYDPITLFTITEEETDYTAYFMVPVNTTYRFRLVRDSSTTQSETITSVIEQVCFETQYAVDLLTGKSYFSNAYVKGSITYPSLVIDTDNYSTYRIDEGGNSYLQLSNVTETNIYIYYFPTASYAYEGNTKYHLAYVALPEITEEMIGKEITICNASIIDGTYTDQFAMELRIGSHGTISGSGITPDLNDPKGLLVTQLCMGLQWAGVVPSYRTDSNALKVPLQHEVRLRAANKNMWVAVGAPYSIIGE